MKATANGKKHTVAPTATRVVNGGRLRIGNPGNKGGGRPPNEHIDWCRRLASDPKCEKQVLEVLRDKDHPAYATMWRAVTDRAYGKPTQPLHHSGRVAIEEALKAIDEDDDDRDG